MTDSKENKGKYGALIQKARQQENQQTIKPNTQIDGKPDNQIDSKPDIEPIKEKEVNLCAKVPELWRRHWAAESKRQGVTMTEVIVEAMEARFGRPE